MVVGKCLMVKLNMIVKKKSENEFAELRYILMLTFICLTSTLLKTALLT